MSEAKKQATVDAIAGMVRPAFVVDMAAFDSLVKTTALRSPRLEPELPVMVRYNPLFSIPVIRSQYVGGYVEDKGVYILDSSRKD